MVTILFLIPHVLPEPYNPPKFIPTLFETGQASVVTKGQQNDTMMLPSLGQKK